MALGSGGSGDERQDCSRKGGAQGLANLAWLCCLQNVFVAAPTGHPLVCAALVHAPVVGGGEPTLGRLLAPHHAQALQCGQAALVGAAPSPHLLCARSLLSPLVPLCAYVTTRGLRCCCFLCACRLPQSYRSTAAPAVAKGLPWRSNVPLCLRTPCPVVWLLSAAHIPWRATCQPGAKGAGR